MRPFSRSSSLAAGPRRLGSCFCPCSRPCSLLCPLSVARAGQNSSIIRAMADALVTSGLRDAGYRTVLIQEW